MRKMHFLKVKSSLLELEKDFKNDLEKELELKDIETIITRDRRAIFSTNVCRWYGQVWTKKWRREDL